MRNHSSMPGMNMPLPGPPGIPGAPGITGVPAPPPMREKAVRPDQTNAESKYTSGQDVNAVLDALPGKLKAGLSAIDSELKRLKKNLAVVQGHEEEINSEEALGHYQQAEAEIAGKYDQILSMRENLYQQIITVDQAVQGVLDELGVGQDKDQPGRKGMQGKQKAGKTARMKTPVQNSPPPSKPITGALPG